MAATAVDSGSGRRASSRSKRDAIIAAAVETFARDGYETSKWADVAAEVGIGSTALYHYFESKLHCLFVVMAEAVEHHRLQFELCVHENKDFREALDSALSGAFVLSDHEALRMRVLVAEQGQIGQPRKSPREESARELARERMRNLEFAWATFLVRGMESRAIPEADPALLARAILGLYTSVWHWYRPGGTVDLDTISQFFVDRQRAVAGLPLGS